MPDHSEVKRSASDERDPVARGGLEEFVNFVGHHEAEPGDDIGLRLSLVECMGTVALAENAAAPGNPARGAPHGKRHRLIEGEPHSPDLLEEEFAGPGSALIAGQHRTKPARAVDRVDKLRLAARTDHRLRQFPSVVHRAERILDRLRFGKGWQRHAPPEGTAGDRDPVHAAFFERPGKEVKKDPLRVPFVREAQRPGDGYCIVNI